MSPKSAPRSRKSLRPARDGKAAGVSPAWAYKLIADLERLGVLREITGGKRGKRYRFDAYLKLFR